MVLMVVTSSKNLPHNPTEAIKCAKIYIYFLFILLKFILLFQTCLAFFCGTEKIFWKHIESQWDVRLNEMRVCSAEDKTGLQQC